MTPLHLAARSGDLRAVKKLLRAGADPNARESGDNTYPLHWAAAHGHVDVVRALLDAGGDPHGFGDVHEADAIGWANEHRAVVDELLARGVRHHIFSAIRDGRARTVREVVKRDPAAIHRRMSRFEHKSTALHFALERKRYGLIGLLVRLGADLSAKDGHGLTAIETATLSGDRKGVRALTAAGAKAPKAKAVSPARFAESVSHCSTMIYVPDVAQALDWYESVGFKAMERYADETGLVNFGTVAMGKAWIMLNMHGRERDQTASLWFTTNEVDRVYEAFKSLALSGRVRIEFLEHINDTFYKARQFGFRDLNGYGVYFIQHL